MLDPNRFRIGCLAERDDSVPQFLDTSGNLRECQLAGLPFDSEFPGSKINFCFADPCQMPQTVFDQPHTGGTVHFLHDEDCATGIAVF